MKKYRVTVRSNTSVAELARENGVLVGVKLKDKKVVRGHSIIIATGGTSRPETGSTGDGYAWLKNIGHTIVMPTPSLVPIALKDTWAKRLAGVKLADIKISVLQNNKRQAALKGRLLFTHVGVSGPTILNMSKDIGELLKYGDVTLSLDLFPVEDQGALDIKLRELFKANDKKKFQNALPGFISKAIAPMVTNLCGIDKDIQCSNITRAERLKLVNLLKGIPLRVDKLLGAEKAIVTSGGVALNEVDFKTMRSRLFPNLYLVGDILNIDRPSGGYSLQLCWTTGFVAGSAAAGKMKTHNPRNRISYSAMS
jgi:hypothetical protein